MSSRSNNFYAGVFLNGGGTIISVVVLFIESVIAVRSIPPSEYGIYVLILSAINFFMLLADGGFKNSITQFVASREASDQSRLVSSILIFRVLLLVFFGALIWFTRGFLTILDPTGGLVAYALFIPPMFLATSFDEMIFSMLRGFHSHLVISVLQAGRSITRFFLTVVFLVIFDFGIEALVLSWTLAYGITGFLGLLSLPTRLRPVFDVKQIIEIVRFGAPLFMLRASYFVRTQADVLMLGRMIGPQGVAFYAVAARIPSGIQSLTEAYSNVFFPTITQLNAKGDKDGADRLLNESLRIISFLMSVMALFSILFGEELMRFVFSETYSNVGIVFGLLMVALHMATLNNLLGYSITASGYPSRTLLSNLVNTILGITGNLIFIPLFSFLGPAFSQIAGVYLVNPIEARFSIRTGYKVRILGYIKPIILMVLIGGIGLLLRYFVPLSVFFLVYFNLIIFLFYILANFAVGSIKLGDFKLLLPAKVKGMLKRYQQQLKSETVQSLRRMLARLSD